MVSEVDQIKTHIENGHDFVLNGGAGSGKTHTLIQTIDYILTKHPKSKIACITYTNVATDEIKKRYPHKNLWVSTIHEFLWDNIKIYQNNLKQKLLNLIQIGEIKPELEIDLGKIQNLEKIQYKDYKKLEEGFISHNEVLKIANHMFSDYQLLCRILQDKYQYILIDEYQDTSRLVIEIFLDHLKCVGHKTIIGLFGDAMQGIYITGIGNVRQYIDNDKLKEVVKSDNYRCSSHVVDLLNKIRDDGIAQNAVKNNIEGDVKFIYSRSKKNLAEIKRHEIFGKWDFNSVEETKELYLTRRLISVECGFENLFKIYDEHKTADDLLEEEKHDDLIKNLFYIQNIIDLYDKGSHNILMDKIRYDIYRFRDIISLRDKILGLKNLQYSSVEEVLQEVENSGFLKMDQLVNDFALENPELYNKVLKINFRELTATYKYITKMTPFSTQHGVKGAEFDNVLVVMDNGGWNQYNFRRLFEEPNSGRVTTTKRIFYVCCSRAKNNLAVFFSEPSFAVLSQARQWFREENVIEVE